MGKYQFYDDAIEYSSNYTEAAKKIITTQEDIGTAIEKLGEYENAQVLQIIEQLNALNTNLTNIALGLATLRTSTVARASAWKAQKIIEERIEEERRRLAAAAQTSTTE